MQKFENFHRCTDAESDSRCCFKNCRNRYRKWPKGGVALITKKTKHVLAPFGGTPGAIPPFFLCECAPWPVTYSPDFIRIGSGLGKL